MENNKVFLKNATKNKVFLEHLIFEKKVSAYNESKISLEYKLNIFYTLIFNIPLYLLFWKLFGGLAATLLMSGIITVSMPVAIAFAGTDYGKVFSSFLFRMGVSRYFSQKLLMEKNKKELEKYFLTEEARDFFARLYLIFEKRVEEIGFIDKRTLEVKVFKKLQKIMEAYVRGDKVEIPQVVFYFLGSLRTDLEEGLVSVFAEEVTRKILSEEVVDYKGVENKVKENMEVSVLKEVEVGDSKARYEI